MPTSVVATCPDDFKLESVLCRLRAGARALFGAGGASPALRARHPDLADYDDAGRERREKAASELRRVGYSEEAFLQDRLALEAALLAAARTCGEIALERIDDIADDFRTIYLSGPDAHANIGDLILTIRNWLPFISFSPYIELYDELPPVPEVSEVEPLPQISMADGPPAAPDPPAIAAPGGAPSEADQLALAEQGDKVGLMQALGATSYMPWRTPGNNVEPTDARRQVLEEEGERDQDLRARLYLDHPILLVVQYLAPPAELRHPVPPRALQAILLLSVHERELALRHVVELCIQHVREAADALRRELAGNDVDWSRFRPLLAWGAEVIAKGEPQPSVVREILDDIISKVARPRLTARDTLAAAAVVVAVVMAVAAFGVGGVAGFVVMMADIAVQTAAVHAHELLTERENAERERMNRVAYVDAALRVASDPEVSDLGWWLGLVSLVILPVAAAGLATVGSRFMRGLALGRAREAAARTLTAARKASMEVTLTRFRVPPEPLVQAPHVAPETPPVGGPRPAVETPATPRERGTPSRQADGGKQPASRSDLFDDLSDDGLDAAPATKPAASADRAPQPELEPDLAKPRAKRSRWAEEEPDQDLADFKPMLDDPQAQVMSELQELIDTTNAMEFERGLAEFEDEVARANTDALAELIDATKAREFQQELAALEERIAANARAEFQRALEEGLARNAAAEAEALRTAGDTAGSAADDVSRMTDQGARGPAPPRAIDPASRTAREQTMKRRLAERIAASSARSRAEDDAAAARMAQSRSVQRPNTGRAISPAEKGTTAKAVAPKSTSQAPKGWRVQKIDPDNPPDLVPDGVILEFATGERVWRSASDDRAIVIESVLGPSSRRRHFEQAYFSRGEMDPSYMKALMERAHSQGQSTGFESYLAITYAPAEVNQVLQNLGIEEFLRVLYENRKPGVTYKLITSTRKHARSLRLSLIEYKIVAEIDGKASTLFTTGIRVRGTAEESVVSLAEDLTHVDAEAFALLPINDLDPSIAQRRREMFERLRARWGRRPQGARQRLAQPLPRRAR